VSSACRWNWRGKYHHSFQKIARPLQYCLKSSRIYMNLFISLTDHSLHRCRSRQNFGVQNRVAESEPESEVFGWSRSRICFPTPTPDVQLDHSLHHNALLNWEFLLKWYNFFWNFCWNRDFLQCTTISSDFSQSNFIPFVFRSRSRKFWKGRSWSRSLIFYLRLRNLGGFLPECRQTCRKKIWVTYCANFFSLKTVFAMTSKGLYAIWGFGTVRAPFFQIKAGWAPFLPVFLGSLLLFTKILWWFSQISPRFPLILSRF